VQGICDQGRHHIPDPRSRRTASKKTDCPFKATRTAFLVAILCISNYTEGLDVIHERWLFKRPHRNSPYIPIDPALLIQDPTVVQRRRGRPKDPTNPRRPNNSTRREPSRFETVGNNTGNVGWLRTLAYPRRPFADVKQRKQHLIKFTRSLAEYYVVQLVGLGTGNRLRSIRGSQDTTADALPPIGSNI